MNIPKKLKVGGKTYTVEETNSLVLGEKYTGECISSDLVIRIRPITQQMKEVIFLHEMLHAIYSHLGYFDHDEKKIEEMANALHMIITDNPDMFKEVNSDGENT